MSVQGRRPSAGNALQPGIGGGAWLARQWAWLAVVLGGILLVLFFQSFSPDWVLFVNDTTLAQMHGPPNRLPAAFTGRWHPGGWVGIEGVAATPTISSILSMLLPPELFLKVYAPFTMFFLGCCSFLFFCSLEFSPAVCVLGGIAAGLNMHFFSVACWGLGSWNMAGGMIFLALAALHSKFIRQTWARATLAGLAVGMNLIEGFDVGAITSIYVGLYIVWRIFTEDAPAAEQPSAAKKILKTVCTEAIVVLFAALIAAHAISSLIDTQVVGVLGAGQDVSTKEKRWNPATQWSLPKIETLRLIAPGLFGYRMTGRITIPDKSSAYWGRVGQDPRLGILREGSAEDRAGVIAALNIPPEARTGLLSDDPAIRHGAVQDVVRFAPSLVRYSGSGEYAGVLVTLLAIFGLANSCRGAAGPLSRRESQAAWFWGGAALVSLLASWGRYSFFYRLIYQLPYVSTIRNPIKFMQPFHIAWIILAGYGLEVLSRRYLRSAARAEVSPVHLQKASGFEKKWITGLLAVVAVSVVGVFVYIQYKPQLMEYLTENGFNPDRAAQIADFSYGEAWWFVAGVAVSSGIIILVLRGTWSGSDAWVGWVLLGLVMALDLARADAPWIHYFNYKEEYAENSVVDFLKDEPYEHRVIGRIEPKGLGSGISSPMGRLYDYWQQNDFAYYGIQALDFSQWSRVPTLDANYMRAFALKGDSLATCDLWPAERLWELTNTRYILTAGQVISLLNARADSRHSVALKTFLRVEKKMDVASVEDVGDMTAVPDGRGEYALGEFKDPLPRAKLFSHWETPANDDATLALLSSRDFDPEQTLLIAPSTPLNEPSGDPKQNAGTVDITDYRPKDVKLDANALTPAVLLLNDKLAPYWNVYVDRKPAPILRCNYLMRGVYLTPGVHTVEFRFQPPLTTLYLSLLAWGIGIATAGYVVFSRTPTPASATQPTPTPAPAPMPSPSPKPVPAAATAPAPQPVGSGNRSKPRRKR
jgi:hypothetical protein